VVLGRHVPQLAFLNILLGDEPVLAVEAHFYQRLLALDYKEARDLMDAFLKDGSLLDLYDNVMIPALSMAEQDRHTGALDEARESFIFQSINEMVLELGDQANHQIRAQVDEKPRILCVPAHDAADEITGAMLAQIAEMEGYPVVSLPLTGDLAELIRAMVVQPGDVVCISSLPPFGLL